MCKKINETMGQDQTITKERREADTIHLSLEERVCFAAEMVSEWEMTVFLRIYDARKHRKKIAEVVEERDAMIAAHGESEDTGLMEMYIDCLLTELEEIMDFNKGYYELEEEERMCISSEMWGSREEAVGVYITPQIHF